MVIRYTELEIINVSSSGRIIVEEQKPSIFTIQSNSGCNNIQNIINI
jgi:hypothetical protein